MVPISLGHCSSEMMINLSISIYFKKKTVYICFKKKLPYEVLTLNKFRVKEIMQNFRIWLYTEILMQICYDT